MAAASRPKVGQMGGEHRHSADHSATDCITCRAGVGQWQELLGARTAARGSDQSERALWARREQHLRFVVIDYLAGLMADG